MDRYQKVQASIRRRYRGIPRHRYGRYNRERIVAMLCGGTRTSIDIATACDMSQRTVLEHMRRFIDDGYVERFVPDEDELHRAYFRLTARGRKASIEEMIA